MRKYAIPKATAIVTNSSIVLSLPAPMCFNILSEYAESIHCNAGTESHYKEHFTLILAKHALQALKQL